MILEEVEEPGLGLLVGLVELSNHITYCLSPVLTGTRLIEYSFGWYSAPIFISLLLISLIASTKSIRSNDSF